LYITSEINISQGYYQYQTLRRDGMGIFNVIAHYRTANCSNVLLYNFME